MREMFSSRRVSRVMSLGLFVAALVVVSGLGIVADTASAQ